ncbi:acyl carrier protein [Streptomyces sp. TRM 70351]|uniref:acyl carrier protein n=1 Tax=Streptomyces sp. TRM 70351 TaxID=3116552 RepID=UPI002E7B5BAE|nr:acyl carrier protein [Streptomyces sp. TRM 70351]MEE1928874.1 acyl carrier protein [Streptomyces sp. TRM 70351]
MTIEKHLISYVADTWLEGDPDGLDEKTPLIELNIIDSSGMFELVHHLQDEYRITVPLREVSPDNFQNVKAIAALVVRLQQKGKDQL